MSRLRSTALCLAPGRARCVGGAAARGRKIPCRSCIAMVPCVLLIENRGGGYQLRPLEESTSCDSRESVIPSTSPSLYTLHLYGTFHVMQRTMRLKLHPMPEQAHRLTATLAQCTDAFNWVCAYGWEHNEKNGVRLHHATYYPVKKVCPSLVSDLVIQAWVKATEALKSAFARRKAQRKVSCPRSQRCAHGMELCTVAAVCGIQGRRSGPGYSGYRPTPHVANLLALRLHAPGRSALASPFSGSALWAHATCRPQRGEKYCGQIPCQSWYIFGWYAVVNRRIVPSATRGEG